MMMYTVALKMLIGDKAKYFGLLIGIAFTAFLVTFALAYFAGFMSRGFALISENPTADVWVMDPAVNSVEQVINMPDAALERVRSVAGVKAAVPLALGDAVARFPDGRFQPFQLIGVDDASLSGAPYLNGQAAQLLHLSDAVVVDAGGSSGKLLTPSRLQDQWPVDGLHQDVPLRKLHDGDDLLINDRRVRVVGVSQTLARFPPHPLMYTRYTEMMRLFPSENRHLTFVMVSAQAGTDARQLAANIQQQTGLRARTAVDFKRDTVQWFLINSEDVGDMTAMLILAMTVGFGVTGILLYMFTYENIRQYALLKAMGTTPGVLSGMIFTQIVVLALLGTGIGIGLCALTGVVVDQFDYPFRLMWFAPVSGFVGVLLVSLMAAAISIRPVLKQEPAIVFAGS